MIPINELTAQQKYDYTLLAFVSYVTIKENCTERKAIEKVGTMLAAAEAAIAACRKEVQ